MAGLGIVLLLAAPLGWRLPSAMPLGWLVSLVGVVGFWFQFALVGHLLLTYPSGRTRDHTERLFVRVAYASAAVIATGHLLLGTADPNCTDRCPTYPLSVVADRQLFLGWWRAGVIVFAVLALVLALLLWRRARTMGARWHRQRVVVLVLSVAVAVAGVGWFFLIAGEGMRQFDWLLLAVEVLVTLVVPGALVIGLWRDRRGYLSVADLVRDLDRVGPADLQAGLARTLQDPGLQLVFPVGEGGDYVDIDGSPVDTPLDGARTMTVIGPPERAVAALIHDTHLSESPGLLEAAGAAAHLSLNNARLQAEVRAQLAEVRASRTRIVTAADEERKRLERNLHDGAQQRLLGIGMTLQLLRSQLDGDTDTTGYLDEIETELRSAILELRELAQGIHPAVLTDEGLAAGVGLLARRAPLKVSVDADIRDRPPRSVEAAAYFIVSEALQNVAKHAQAGTATIRLRCTDGQLEIVVTDDGCGGATLDSGSGLRGLADRALALDGTFDFTSEPGCGTCIRVNLPCG
jgi:signal transduction histidine kinase